MRSPGWTGSGLFSETHEHKTAIRAQSGDAISHRIHRVACAEDHISAACCRKTLAITNNFVGTQFANHFILICRARDGDRREPGSFRVLNGEMPEAANADDSKSLSGLGLPPAQARPNRVTGAENRRGLFIAECFGQEHGGVGVSEHVFCVAAGNLHAGAHGLLAEDWLAASAPLAAAARVLNPGNADPVADPPRCHAGADCDDLADRFMAKSTRKITRKLSTSLVHISVAQAASMDLDENLAWSRLRGLCLFNFPPAVGGGDDSCSHRKYQKFVSWFVFKNPAQA